MRIALLLLAAVALPCDAVERSRAERSAFVYEHPCPATGSPGPCPGWVVDHVIPLCAGGPDKRYNMQWQAVPEGKYKDVYEHRFCRHPKIDSSER
jgi:hypothetical protein